MQKLIVCMLIAVFMLLLAVSPVSASRAAGISLSPGFSFGGHFSSTSASGSISTVSGTVTQNFGIFGSDFLQVNVAQPKVTKTSLLPSKPAMPEAFLPNLPGPDWSPSFKAPQ